MIAKSAKHTAAGICWSSPTQLLIRRSVAYVWQSGRDAQILICLVKKSPFLEKYDAALGSLAPFFDVFEHSFPGCFNHALPHKHNYHRVILVTKSVAEIWRAVHLRHII